MKQLLSRLSLFTAFSMAICSMNAQTGNVGIGTTSPTHKLHVVSTSNPVRFERIVPADNTVAGTLVADADGVIKMKTANSISAIRATGSFTLAANNTAYFNDITAAPAETFDNLGEFTGHTFTPAQPGLYQVNFTVNFNQRDGSFDSGDGYNGYVQILAGTATGAPLTAPSYSNVANKVTVPEISGTASYSSSTNSELVKLSAGEVIQFKITSYGTSNGVGGNYVINISRVD